MVQEKFTLPYRETPYTITAQRRFYHPQTIEVDINPSNPNPVIDFNLVRKTGEWRQTTWTEPIPFERQVVNDINVRPENSYIQTQGVDGVRTFSGQQEFIDNEWTGEYRNETSSITTQPVNEVYIQGTAVITWKDMSRTESVPFTTEEYNSNDYLVGERVTTTAGVNGVRTYTWQEEYMNNVTTGTKRNETNAITTQPVTQRIAVGTKPNEITWDTTTSAQSTGPYATSILVRIEGFEGTINSQIISVFFDNQTNTIPAQITNVVAGAYIQIGFGGSRLNEAFPNFTVSKNMGAPVRIVYRP